MFGMLAGFGIQGLAKAQERLFGTAKASLGRCQRVCKCFSSVCEIANRLFVCQTKVHANNR